jgi:adenosylcobyric acid synthase
MNPILMKPESDRSAQIVVQGKVWGKAEARTYFEEFLKVAPPRLRAAAEQVRSYLASGKL